MRKLSLACGIFHRSDQLVFRLTTLSQVVQFPCRPYDTALILLHSSSILVTCATTISFVCFLSALLQTLVLPLLPGSSQQVLDVAAYQPLGQPQPGLSTSSHWGTWRLHFSLTDYGLS